MVRKILRNCPFWRKWALRNYAAACDTEKKGLVLGVYEGCCPGEFKLSEIAKKYDECVDGKITNLLQGQKIKRNKPLVFGNVGNEFYQLAVASLSHDSADFNPTESLDECRENIRTAVGLGTIALQDQGINRVFVEGVTSAESAAEGAQLAAWSFQEWKSKEDRASKDTKVELYGTNDMDGWQRGELRGKAQNLARYIEQSPSNLMTPYLFAKYAAELLCPCGVGLEFMDRNWLELEKFNALLSVGKASCEPPAMLQLSYCGGSNDDAPIVLVGKGATFDSGGLPMNRKEDMATLGRAELSGAAVILAVFRAVAQMKLPINLSAVLGLYENLVSGSSLKPGDVVVSRNGKTILIEDTGMTGRVTSADLLSFAATLEPCLVFHLSTSKASMAPAIGFPPTGVFSTSDVLWKEMERAGSITGDRLWRFPIWKYFRSRINDYDGVDVSNKGRGPGYPCMVPAFLLEFSPRGVDLMHMDISESGRVSKGIGMPYLRKGLMTGRPTRALIQFLYRVACPHDPEPC